MVNVYTNNGQFNITESLMEAIKANNPELLVEKKDSEQTAKKKAQDAVKKISNIIPKYYSDYDLTDVENDYNYDTRLKAIINLVNNNPNIGKKSNDYIIKQYNKERNRLDGDDAWHTEFFRRWDNDVLTQKTKYAIHKKLNDKDDDRHKGPADLEYDKQADEYYKNYEDIVNKKLMTDRAEFRDKLSKQSLEAEQKKKYNILSPESAIIYDQYIENGGDISNGLEIDGKKMSKEEVLDMIKNDEVLGNKIKEFDNDKESRNKIKKLKKEIEKNKSSYDSSDSNPQNLKDLLNSETLKKEITSIEYAAQRIIIGCKRAIGNTLALAGTNVNDTNGELIPTKNANDNTNTNTNTNNLTKGKNQYDLKSNGVKKSGVGKRLQSYGLLGIGGYRIAPYILSANDKETIGKAASCYKISTESNNENSLVDNLINYFIQYKNNDKVLKREENWKVNKDDLKKLEATSINFLHNVVYKLQIADETKFEPILNAIRWNNSLMDKYEIRNTGNLRMFNVKEQSISFMDRQTKAVVLILIASPLFAGGAELFKQAVGAFKDNGIIKG